MGLRGLLLNGRRCDPDLLFTLVLEKGLLPVVSASATAFGKEARQPSSRLIRLVYAVWPLSATSMRLSAAIIRPSSMINLAFFAEILALLGIAAPAAWRANGLGLAVAFIVMGFIAFVIVELLALVAMGLVAIAGSIERPKSSQVGEDDPGQATPEDAS
jgi:hypothetical protein